MGKGGYINLCMQIRWLCYTKDVMGGRSAKNVPYKGEGQENLNMASLHLHHPPLKIRFIIPLYVVSFHRIRAREQAKYASVFTVQFRFDRFFAKGRQSKNKMHWNTVINLIFGVMVDNTRRHFTHCSQYSASRKISA